MRKLGEGRPSPVFLKEKGREIEGQDQRLSKEKTMKSPAYTAMMDRVLAEIDQGTMPWRRPWRNGAVACLPARNTGEPFTGGNILLLSMAAAFNGFSGNRWFTFKQAEALGGRVRKGEKSSVAILCNRTTKEDETGDPEKVRHLTYTKAYPVFCADQIDGLDAAYYGRPPARRDLSTFEISDFIRRLALPVQHKGDMAYYDTRTDKVVMPHPEQFDTLDDYQATLLHEAGHLTGSAARLNRKDLETYHLHASRAREELTALS